MSYHAKTKLRPSRAFTLWLLWLALLGGCRTSPLSPDITTPTIVAAAMAEAASDTKAGAYTAAAAAYRRALEADPIDPQPALALADLYLQWGYPQKGLEALAEAARRGAPEDSLRYRRLNLLLAARAWDKAREAAQAILETSPENPQALTVLIQTSLQQGNCRSAKEAAIRLVRADPNRQASTAQALLTGDFQQLRTLAPSLLTSDDDCGNDCAPIVGYRLIRVGQWGMAACVLQQVTATQPDNANAHAWLGEALARLGKLDHAQAELRQAVLLAPDNPLNWLLLGKTHMIAGDLIVAETALLKAQQLDPQNPAPCLALAELQARLGRYQRMTQWARTATQRAPNDPDIWKIVARMFLERNLIDEELTAEATIKAATLAPQDAEAQTLLGWMHLLQDEPKAALTALNRAIELDPQLAEAYFLRAQALRVVGDPADATASWIRAADLGYPVGATEP